MGKKLPAFGGQALLPSRFALRRAGPLSPKRGNGDEAEDAKDRKGAELLGGEHPRCANRLRALPDPLSSRAGADSLFSMRYKDFYLDPLSSRKNAGTAQGTREVPRLALLARDGDPGRIADYYSAALSGRNSAGRRAWRGLLRGVLRREYSAEGVATLAATATTLVMLLLRRRSNKRSSYLS
jgi:hypothetical protein